MLHSSNFNLFLSKSVFDNYYYVMLGMSNEQLEIECKNNLVKKLI